MATKIYTKTGDNGETSLFGGARVSKDSLRIEAYGTIDELNSLLGVVQSGVLPDAVRKIIDTVQDDLFIIGADMATPETKKGSVRTKRLRARSVERLEEAIDSFQEKMPELHSFILPGGAPPAAELHFARAVCRRAERLCVRLSRTEKINSIIIPYLNRCSDLLFVMARYVNHDTDHSEILWPRK